MKPVFEGLNPEIPVWVSVPWIVSEIGSSAPGDKDYKPACLVPSPSISLIFFVTDLKQQTHGIEGDAVAAC